MLVQDYPPYANLYWEADVKALRMEWTRLHMSPEEFQKISDKNLEQVKMRRCKVIIVDMYMAEGAIPTKLLESMTDQEREREAIEAGLEIVVMILPGKLGIASMSAKRLNTVAEERDAFQIVQVANLAEAKKWLHTQQVGA